MRLTTVSILCLLGALLGGCGKDESASPAAAAQPGAPAAPSTVNVGPAAAFNPLTADPAQVVVVVNGEKITCGDYQARLDLEKAVYRNRRAKATKQPKAFEKEIEGFGLKRAPHVLPILVNQVLVKKTLAAEKLVLTPEESEAEMLKQRRAFNIKKGGDAALAKALGVEVDYLKDQLLDPARHKKLRDFYDPAALKVSEQEVDEGLARQTAYYERAIASNAVTYVTCSNVLAEVRGGLGFAAAAKKYPMVDPELATEGEELDPEDFDEGDDPKIKAAMFQLRKWAFTEPIGSVTGPVEMPDGLAIVKLLGRRGALAAPTKGKDEDETDAELEAEVQLARLVFPMVEPEPEPRTREFVRQSLLKWKADKAQKAMCERIQSGMKLDYPNGTNFVFKAANKEMKE